MTNEQLMEDLLYLVLEKKVGEENVTRGSDVRGDTRQECGGLYLIMKGGRKKRGIQEGQKKRRRSV